LTDKFCRTVYSRPDRPNAVLITYTGDHTVAAQFAHGNAKKTTRNYVRTQPHVLQAVKNASGTAKSIYQTMVATAANSTDTTPVTAAPRNAEQVRNTQKRERNKQRLSRDALYNLHEFAYDSGFIHKICTFPDLSVICYNQDVVAVFNSLLSTSAQSATPTIVITYDTTFNLGDFYLSILLFRETEFEPSPIIPLAYYIHERKLQATHDEFFGHIRLICPQLDQSLNAVLITDNEAAITGSVNDNFPNLPAFLCWNHVLQDCKRWLRQHGVTTTDEMTYYVDKIRELLQAASAQEYNSRS